MAKKNEQAAGTVGAKKAPPQEKVEKAAAKTKAPGKAKEAVQETEAKEPVAEAKGPARKGAAKAPAAEAKGPAKKGAAKAKRDEKSEEPAPTVAAPTTRPLGARSTSGRDDDLQKRLTPEEVEEFRLLLSERRQSLLESARETMAAQESLEARAPDEVDQASTEYDQSFEYRMRDREKFLLRKIEKALQRIEEGEYDICESCGNPIGRKRLLARPETTYCIVCKEEQERQEKMFQKRRQMRATLDF